MTLAKDMPEHAVLVAIDVAKHRNEILIEAPGRVRRRRLTVLNTRADHDRLVEALAAFEAPVVAGFEATGNYHRPLAHRQTEPPRVSRRLRTSRRWSHDEDRIEMLA